MATLGSYKGIDIEPGTDEQVQSQIKNIDAGKTPETNFLSSADLAQTPGLDIPKAAPSTSVSGELGRFESQADQFTKNLETRQQESQDQEKSSFEDLIRETLEAPTQSGLESKTYGAKGGVDDIQTELDDINSQLRNEQQALRRRIEKIRENKEGMFGGAVEQEVSRVERESLSKQADLAVIQQSVQGRYDSAKTIADRAVNAQMEYEQRRIDLLELTYNRNKSLFDKDEQRLFETKQADRQRKIEEQAQNKKDIYSLGLTAAQNGASQQVMQQIFAAQSPKDAVRLASGYLRDPLQDQLTKLQIAKANQSLTEGNLSIREKQLTLKQLETSSEVLNDETWGSVINSTASLVGAERGKEIRQNMARNIASGNYKAAWSDVTNAVEEKLTGENATKFGAAVTDYQVLTGLENAIQTYADGGGDLGLLTGKAEDISRKLLGVTGDPKLTELAVQLEREFQTYRTNATGAAFSPEESREYAKVNPRSTASLDLNLATIQGAKNQLENRILSNVKTRVPGAEALWAINTGQSASSYLESVDQSLRSTPQDDISSLLNSIKGEIGQIK